MNINPSAKWTIEERTKVAANLASELNEKAATSFVTREDVLEFTERIAYVLVQPAAFLESNRTRVLEGFGKHTSNSKEVIAD